jgi:Uma2 family endonuclease
MDTTIVLKDSITGGMTDEEFLRFCLENRDLRIERNSNLEIVIMPPVTTPFGAYGSAVNAQLYMWNAKQNSGVCFDSSTGFTLPDGSVLSPDSSWVSNKKWHALPESDRDGFAPICPEFVIEIRSRWDNILEVKKKMNVWLKNGARVAWLIDPIKKQTIIYDEKGSEEIIHGFNTALKGTGPIQGFELDLTQLEIK